MLKLILHILTATIMLLSSSLGFATDPGLYSDRELREAKQLYETNVRGMFRKDLVQRLSSQHRYALSDVRLAMPLRGKHPLQFSARPSDRTVIIPVSSMKFLDELTIAWAWFELSGCRTEYLTSYLSLLLRFNAIDQGPLEAFDLPKTIIKKQDVDDLSLKLSKSALYFLLAHEAGHLLYNHQPAPGGPTSQRQERAADAFALSAMARVGVVPFGMLQYFIAGYMFEPLPDLETWEFQTGVIAELTHPLASARVRHIAERLAKRPIDYAHSERNPQAAAQLVGHVAQQMSEIADHMDHGGMKLYSASWLIEHFPQSRFAVACPAS